MFLRTRTYVALRLRELKAYFADVSLPSRASTRNVIIFAQGRSGTTLLEELLCSTGYFVSHGEALNCVTREVTAPVRFVRGLGKLSDPRGAIVHVKGSHLVRDRKRSINPAHFLSSLHRDGWTVVNVVRSNIARQVLSECVALARGDYHKRDDAPDRVRIRVSPEEFLRRHERREMFREEEQNALAGVPNMSFSYEADLETPSAQQATIDRILRALNLPRRSAATTLRKINTAAPEEILENFDDVDEALRARNISW